MRSKLYGSLRRTCTEWTRGKAGKLTRRACGGAASESRYRRSSHPSPRKSGAVRGRPRPLHQRKMLKPTPLWDDLGCGGTPREGGARSGDPVIGISGDLTSRKSKSVNHKGHEGA